MMNSNTEDKTLVTPDDDILNISQNIKNDLHKLLEDEDEMIINNKEEEQIQFDKSSKLSPEVYDDDNSKRIEKDLQAVNFTLNDEIYNKYKGKFKIIICSQIGSRIIQKCFVNSSQEINGKIAEEVSILIYLS